MLSAHSHFAFGGWAGLSLIVLLTYNLLPANKSGSKLYQGILWGIEISSVGMALTFPFVGYAASSIFFSSLYIVVYFVFAPVFIKDLLLQQVDKSIKLLSISAVTALLISTLGPLGLSYILATKSGNSILYRDAVYTFLHFQYNGFFTLSVVALFLDYLLKKGETISQAGRRFVIFLCLSVIPTLFLSLLWHNLIVFYVLAAIGCLLILASLFFFVAWIVKIEKHVFIYSIAQKFFLFAAVSLALKLGLNVGTIVPQLGDAVYGARPVIIGFLHLVFLGFLTFFILALLTEYHFFTKDSKVVKYPLMVFAIGIFSNEILLGVQGMGILLGTNTVYYNWLLWGASIFLFVGALLLIFTKTQLSTLPD